MWFSRDHSYSKYLSFSIPIIQNNNSLSLNNEIVEVSRILSETGKAHQMVIRGTERWS